MATAVTMPQMGFDMTEGSIHTWVKKEGDQVQKGETIAEIDTDKATVEMEAFASGVLKRIVVQEGELVPVGQIIAVIADANEQVDWAKLGLEPGGDGNIAAVAATSDSATDQGRARKSAGEGGEARSENETISLKEVETAAPEAQRVESGVAQIENTGTPKPQTGTGTQTYAPVAAQTVLAPANIVNAGVSTQPRTLPGNEPAPWVKSSPYARTVASDLGVNIATVSGTGPDGRVIAADVQNYAKSQPQTATQVAQPMALPAAATPAPAASNGTVQAAGEYEERELSRMRQTIARRMTEAKQTVPHFYVSSEIDMGEALKWRQQLNAAVEREGGTKISVNDMVIKAAAKALLKFPAINASYANGKVRFNNRVNVAMAVALDEGLITPVVMDADKKSLGTIASDARQLIEKARVGGLKPEQFQGGTFTVSNLGMYDVDSFVAIINPPQAAILAVGSVKPTVVVKGKVADDGSAEFGVVQQMKVTISADHRVTDGAVAAQFLQELKRILQNPLSLLI